METEGQIAVQPNPFLKIDFDKVLGPTGSIASIIGLVLTLFVYLSVNKIRSYYTLAGRVPQLKERLDAYSQQLVEYGDNIAENVRNIAVLFTRIEVLATELDRIVKFKDQDVIYKLFVSMSKPNVANISQEEIDRVYIAIIRVSAELEILDEGLRWKR